MNRYRAAAARITPVACWSVVLRWRDLKIALIMLEIFVPPALFTKR
jgi:hypothetical protein